MDTLTLNCWIRSGDGGSIFQVMIPKTGTTVYGLKKAIKNEMLASFSGRDADSLCICKPKNPLSKPYKEKLNKFVLSEHGELLEGIDELSEIFPQPPLKSDIHIIIDAPPPIVCCWLRGGALDDLFYVPFQHTILEFLQHIRNKQPGLRDVAGQHIRLYRIQGGDDELSESLMKTGDGELLRGIMLAPNFLGVPILDPWRVVIDVSTVTKPLSLRCPDSGGADSVKTARMDFIQAREKKSPSNGSKPSAFRETQRVEHTHIPCGRPRAPEELIPVTLLHKVFGEFVDDCQTGTMTKADNQFCGKLANVLSDLYNSESDRVRALNVVFIDGGVHFDFSEKIPGTDYLMDASLSIAGADLPPYCIAEFKNEVGSTTSEPYLQAVARYTEATKKYASQQSNFTWPCFLLINFGPYIVFAGAVWNLRPVVQILSTPLAFHYHSTDTSNQLTVARHMAAFRKALKTLGKYYTYTPREPNQSRDTLFPYPTDFESLEDGSTHTISYTQQLEEAGNKENLLFFGTLAGSDATRICIKFARRYSKEAHLHCAELGFAPKLRGFKVLPGGWYMIVMDRLVNYDELADLAAFEFPPRSLVEAIGKQLETLHARQMVHGDIRDTNILVKRGDRTKFMIIDFDWAGVEDVTRYPPYVNYADIERPKGARDGEPIKAVHDIEMLKTIAKRWTRS